MVASGDLRHDEARLQRSRRGHLDPWHSLRRTVQHELHGSLRREGRTVDVHVGSYAGAAGCKAQRGSDRRRGIERECDSKEPKDHDDRGCGIAPRMRAWPRFRRLLPPPIPIPERHRLAPFGSPAGSGSPVALRPRLATGVLFRGPSVIPDGAVASLAFRGRQHKMDLVGMTQPTRARDPVHRYYRARRPSARWAASQ